MAASLEETLISVWQQALVENARSVKLENRSFPVRRTSRSKLEEVDFRFEGRELRGLEQNPETASRWAQLAREGKRLCSFSAHAATLRLSCMERCSSTGKWNWIIRVSARDKKKDASRRGRKFRRIELTPGSFCDEGITCRKCSGTGTSAQCGCVAQCRAVR